MLLPSRFKPETLPTLGPAIRKPEPVKVDPILSFNKGDHRLIDTSALTPWAYASSVCITEADCQQFKGAATARRSESTPADDGKVDTPVAAPPFSLDLGSGEVKVEEPKFRVGDRVCHTLSSQLRFAVHSIEKNDHCTWVRCIREGDAQPVYAYKERDLELIPSPPTSDGWIPHDGKSGCPVPPGTVVDVRLRDGYEAKGQVALKFAGLANDEQWVESDERDELTIAAYRVIK